MIEVRNLWKSYNGNRVLKGLNLEVEAGETVVILGRSGCGKSGVLRQVLGIENPDEGAVIVAGINISQLKEHDLYQAIHEMGMLFQASALFASLTVGENTAFYLNQHNHHTEKEIKELVAEALKMVGLEGKDGRAPPEPRHHQGDAEQAGRGNGRPPVPADAHRTGFYHAPGPTVRRRDAAGRNFPRCRADA